MTNAIAVRQLIKQYPNGVDALQGIDLEIRPGEFFGLLGPNGAGKSTLIQCLGGLIKPTSGHISLMGHDLVAHRREATRHIGIVPQEITFDPFLTVWETLSYQAGYWGVRDAGPWIHDILERLSLGHKKHERVHALSGGMKRRVLVAQALVHRPSVIVLDEPTAGVDIALRQSLWTFMNELNRAGHTIILTTHHLDEAEAHCGRIGMMKNGRIVALDRTDGLLKNLQGLCVRFHRLEGRVPDDVGVRLMPLKDDRWVFHAAHVDEAYAALKRLTDAGLAVDRVSITPPTLEDVFTTLTGSTPS